jgi:hypothetical protein
MYLIEAYFARIERFGYVVHAIQALLVLFAFILGCALLSVSSMPRSRSTTLILVYAIKSALFLVYQYLTKKVDRFRRFASLKAYMILDTMDSLLWFTAFIISCMGGKSSNKQYTHKTLRLTTLQGADAVEVHVQ